MNIHDATEVAYKNGYEDGSKAMYEQVIWERDIALDQLANIGKSLGEKMDDIILIKHNYDMLIRFFKTHPVCKLCKYHDKESLNYGYTTTCEDCGWYPWDDEETVPYHWKIKENLNDRDLDE